MAWYCYLSQVVEVTLPMDVVNWQMFGDCYLSQVSRSSTSCSVSLKVNAVARKFGIVKALQPSMIAG